MDMMAMMAGVTEALPQVSEGMGRFTELLDRIATALEIQNVLLAEVVAEMYGVRTGYPADGSSVLAETMAVYTGEHRTPSPKPVANE